MCAVVSASMARSGTPSPSKPPTGWCCAPGTNPVAISSSPRCPARAGLVLRGGAQCNELRLHPEDILLPPGLAITPRRSLCDGLALLLEANVALGLALHAAERLELAQSSELLRLLGLGLVLSEQAAAQLDDDIAAGAGLSFSRSSHFSNLAIQALAVAREAAQSSLRAEGLRARLLGAAH